ncbi:butyryl-CoA:acetoacetate CoA-transferase beta subunit [Natronincola peptidivorans]|uniref:Butyryl-CoA:acetoacetate CoA-transferase beta subunit n=1 Tax=Natronincola peptidivorans TaxID=426128 RepID=A0A1I0D585_9FIRM|nr:3-oxoacid CoA-transferase subunit B [Natronincola peptidivorans]SET27422.1 butyryl-CoA:acetoacetate CoA-transferase beta subunit [Natronincola peptidivorans]
MDSREIIARRVAKELNDGDIVNLGIGMPTKVSDFIPDDVEVILQSENGFVYMGPAPQEGQEDDNIVNAGGLPVTVKTGASFFDSAVSFGIIRGGHVDATVLGALQVDEKGNLASWMIPGKMVPGMGGAMDLVVGAKKVIIAMEHTAKGRPKILKECTLPLTAVNEVDLIVTEICVIEVTKEGLVLKEVAEGVTVEDVQEVTEAALIIPENVKTMDIGL